MISIIITAFHEEKTIAKSIKSFLDQDIKEKFEIMVVAPDDKTIDVAKRYPVKIFRDQGKGKSFALNLLLKKVKGDILILTDGDLYVERDSINNLIKHFKDDSIGVVAGRVVSSNQKDNMFGYWSHLLADAGAHKIRKRLSQKNKFLECSAYLFAFRNNIIKEIPIDVAEDAIIPYLLWKKGYKIAYAEDAIVYVKNPYNFKDWIKQRKRTADAHTKLTRYYPDFPRVKSFSNELKHGILWALAYPKSIKEFYWTVLLFLSRFYMWLSLKYDLKFKKREYSDGWERIESTR